MFGRGRQKIEYIGLLTGLFVLAMIAAWTPLGTQIDSDVYDWMFRLYRPSVASTESMLLSIDEDSLRDSGGVQGLRRSVAEGLELLAGARPKAVAIDVMFVDEGIDPEGDARLETALKKTK